MPNRSDIKWCILTPFHRIPENSIFNMASCMLSILDSLKLHDEGQLNLEDETLSEIMFRKMKGYNIDLNHELGFNHLKPIKKRKT